MNKLKKWLRDWHIWLGVAFAIPLLIIGFTTLLLAHQNQLKLDRFYISSTYFPGYWNETSESKNPLKTFFKDEKGNEYFGYKYGLSVKKNNRLVPIEFFNRFEIREIDMLNNKLIVATKQGLFLEEDTLFKTLLKEDIWDISFTNNQAYITTKMGFYTCDLLFVTCEKKDANLFIEPLQEVSLKKLNLDLHTGKALFGKNLEWLWQDILALCLLFFVLSGFYLWYKKKSNKNKKILF